jgi:hypothetical protein
MNDNLVDVGSYLPAGSLLFLDDTFCRSVA